MFSLSFEDSAIIHWVKGNEVGSMGAESFQDGGNRMSQSPETERNMAYETTPGGGRKAQNKAGEVAGVKFCRSL